MYAGASGRRAIPYSSHLHLHRDGLLLSSEPFGAYGSGSRGLERSRGGPLPRSATRSGHSRSATVRSVAMLALCIASAVSVASVVAVAAVYSDAFYDDDGRDVSSFPASDRGDDRGPVTGSSDSTVNFYRHSGFPSRFGGRAWGAERCSKKCVAGTTVLAFYGRYCGYMYTGCPGYPPCDALDSCCFTHDKCVDARGYSDAACSEALYRCVLCVAADPLSSNATGRGFGSTDSPSARAVAIHIAKTIKLSLGRGR
jgi:hypothetical protein